jgi:hypothetical protein
VTARADDPDLGVSGRTRLVHDPLTALVHATVDVTLTNRKPSTSTSFFYYDAYTLPVPAGSRDVRATSGGNRLSTSVRATRDPSVAILLIDLPRRLLYGQTRRIHLTYDIAGAQPRSENQTRVGVGYATFLASSPGDEGHNRLEVVLPAEMTWDSTEEDLFTERTTGDHTILVATETNSPDGIWAPISAQADGGLIPRFADVGGATITVRSWPGDNEWATSVSDTVTKGIPALERITGRPWPEEIESIREDSTTGIFGFDGWYDDEAHEIVLGDSHEPQLVLHELSHAWSNSRNLRERWMSEGLAEFLARKAVVDIRAERDASRPVSRTSKDAIALGRWTWSDDGVSSDDDDYAYPASAQVMTALLGRATRAQLGRLIADLSAGHSAYDRTSESLREPRAGWTRFLDLVEADTGNTGAAATMRTWVLEPKDHAVLGERQKARARWTAIDTADGPWQPPIALRRSMTNWDFASAREMASEVTSAATNAGKVQEAAARAGVEVPAPIREAYEQANGDGDLERAGRVLSRAVAAVPQIARAEESVSSAERGGPLVAFAAEQLGVRHDLEAASASLGSGEGDPAALARRAADRAGWALPLAFGGLVGSLVLAFALAGLVATVVGRRAARRA